MSEPRGICPYAAPSEREGARNRVGEKEGIQKRQREHAKPDMKVAYLE
jgi:hypothetical protein